MARLHLITHLRLGVLLLAPLLLPRAHPQARRGALPAAARADLHRDVLHVQLNARRDAALLARHAAVLRHGGAARDRGAVGLQGVPRRLRHVGRAGRALSAAALLVFHRDGLQSAQKQRPRLELPLGVGICMGVLGLLRMQESAILEKALWARLAVHDVGHVGHRRLHGDARAARAAARARRLHRLPARRRRHPDDGHVHDAPCRLS
mmetsp:Transcript_57728/g.132571  ORF Transcript_57728/g.132571 Transcript_57728/m.132571 type:complete len:207 (+) Transcript_57728:304-924(+)